MPTRRKFLSAALIGLTAKADRPIRGSFVNESQINGHKIRDHQKFRMPGQVVNVPVVIVGGGIAGLSAAWQLERRGFRDFRVLEMEPESGGNARFGENEITAYPWAAHYIPVPNKEAVYVRELMEEFGALRDGRWNERFLCFSPQERLFLHGRWQEGIEPDLGVPTQDREEFRRFFARMQEFRESREFTIPMEVGAKRSPLDAVNITEWMRGQGFRSPYLSWYVDYSCRDDYGGHARDISAWAGIHYFASRERDEKGPLTWPEGNGWILRRLRAKLNAYIRTNTLVYGVVNRDVKRATRSFSVLTPETEYRSDHVIFAAPSFLAPHLLESSPVVSTQYSPWLTANLTLDRLPPESGPELAWDNVIYDSPTLGYVNATHMTLRSRTERAVWTFYWALADESPAESRKRLLSHDWGYWKEAILNDLSRAHPNIRECVSRMDIMRIGHAMARPVPGSIFSESQEALRHSAHRLLFANSDLSSFSIFEEAQYRGVRAADIVLDRLSGRRRQA